MPATPLHPTLTAALLLAAAGVAGFLAERLGVPLPWMIGPMLMTAAIGLTKGDPPVAWFYRPLGQVTVATGVGLYFTRDAFLELVEQGGWMVAGAFLTIAAGYIAALVLVRLARTDGTTAFFASMPGGPVEMANLAEKFGVPGGPVALAQTMRIAGIVLIIAPLLLWTQGAIGGLPPRPGGVVSLGGLVGLYALAVAAALVFKTLNVSNAFFLGPVGITALVTAAGLHFSAIPFPVLAAGQVLLGVSLGSRFDKTKLAGALTFVLAALASTAVLLLLCFAIGVAISRLSGTPLPSLVVSTAPGSVTEMALTAKALNAAVAMVTAYHLVRIFILIPLAPYLYRLFKGVAGYRVPFANPPGQ
jgi:hypothetical protein